MNKYDVVWSTSDYKWVVRKTHLRFLGDTITARDVSVETADRIAQEQNRLGLGEHFTVKSLLAADGAIQRTSGTP